MSDSETHGVDLAQVALRAAMERARKSGSGQKAKQRPRPVRTARRDGRDPMDLGATIGALLTERAWEVPAAGASLRQRWAAIAPELARHVTAVSYDPDSGQFTVCPESAAWATQTRLEQTRSHRGRQQGSGPQCRERPANPAARRRACARSRRRRPGGPGPGTGPARTRETACEGYRRSLPRISLSLLHSGWSRGSRRRWRGRPGRCAS
ncbi:DciA family protein [Streptomyces sp. NBC_01717]|uniref:DciA family protein n=1 Tax=Streptomyces sp. NBC_01717 TaxID=2975918 RepID=UPI002E354523|nr:DciA family protein [Streptomyces sp. NBC_01717]